MLTPSERSRVDQAFPLLPSCTAMEPFRVRRIRRPSVTWINDRWLLGKGLNTLDPDTRHRVVAWLIDEFAFSVPETVGKVDEHTGEERTFHADRYGGAGFVPHGGSGRTGTTGIFQVKGIGVTPLVGAAAEEGYATGAAWLEEALREALFSELAACEFPGDAVPVIAVIDAGINHVNADGTLGQRRALIVRPAVRRLAHMERAPMFRTGNTWRQCPSTSDTERVRSAVGHYVNSGWRMERAMASIAGQVAFGRAHRLFYGGYLTSNLTPEGDLFDFGSFRAVPDWCHVATQDNMPGFGSEELILHSAARSLAFHFNKYAGQDTPQVDAAKVAIAASQAIEESFDHQCMVLWGLEDAASPALKSEIVEAMRGYYRYQQRIRVSLERGFRSASPWIHDALPASAAAWRNGASGSEEDLAVDKVMSAITCFVRTTKRPASEAEHALQTARRLLMPRPELTRERLQDDLFGLLGGPAARQPVAFADVRHFFTDRLSGGRRFWRSLPKPLVVRAQVTHGHASALLCRDVDSNEDVLWIEATRCDEQVALFQRAVPSEALEQWRVGDDDHYWRGIIPATSGGASAADAVGLSANDIPPMAFWFNRARH